MGISEYYARSDSDIMERRIGTGSETRVLRIRREDVDAVAPYRSDGSLSGAESIDRSYVDSRKYSASYV